MDSYAEYSHYWCAPTTIGNDAAKSCVPFETPAEDIGYYICVYAPHFGNDAGKTMCSHGDSV